MPTSHNSAKQGEIAKTVVMCGDPLRVKFIAENYLENAKIVSEVRCAYCYTGVYKGKEISVMAHGMGIPSMAIYSYELFKEYNVDTIIRAGTCGSYDKNINLKDLIVAVGASSDSNYAAQFNLNGTFAPVADYSLLRLCDDICKKHKIKANFGGVFCSDVFYDENSEKWKKWSQLGVLGVEMESYALYINAARTNKKALTILAVTDNFITGERASIEDRQNGFKSMIEVALEVALEA